MFKSKGKIVKFKPMSCCKGCASFKNNKCTRKSLYDDKYEVCWFEEEY